MGCLSEVIRAAMLALCLPAAGAATTQTAMPRPEALDAKAVYETSQAAVGGRLGEHVLRDQNNAPLALAEFRGRPLVISLIWPGGIERMLQQRFSHPLPDVLRQHEQVLQLVPLHLQRIERVVPYDQVADQGYTGDALLQIFRSDREFLFPGLQLRGIVAPMRLRAAGDEGKASGVGGGGGADGHSSSDAASLVPFARRTFFWVGSSQKISISGMSEKT